MVERVNLQVFKKLLLERDTSAVTDPVKTGQDILGGVENVTRAARAFVGQGVPAKDSSKQSSNRNDYVLRDGKWHRK